MYIYIYKSGFESEKFVITNFHWTVLSHCTTIVKPSREHTGIKISPEKATSTTLLHYHWETKVKQSFLATDEIVVLHVMHTDIQPGRVAMKQRPSW